MLQNGLTLRLFGILMSGSKTWIRIREHVGESIKIMAVAKMIEQVLKINNNHTVFIQSN